MFYQHLTEKEQIKVLKSAKPVLNPEEKLEAKVSLYEKQIQKIKEKIVLSKEEFEEKKFAGDEDLGTHVIVTKKCFQQYLEMAKKQQK